MLHFSKIIFVSTDRLFLLVDTNLGIDWLLVLSLLVRKFSARSYFVYCIMIAHLFALPFVYFVISQIF